MGTDNRPKCFGIKPDHCKIRERCPWVKDCKNKFYRIDDINDNNVERNGIDEYNPK